MKQFSTIHKGPHSNAKHASIASISCQLHVNFASAQSLQIHPRALHLVIVFPHDNPGIPGFDLKGLELVLQPLQRGGMTAFVGQVGPLCGIG